MKELEYYYCEGCYWLKDDECLFRDASISNFKCEIDEKTGLGKCNTQIKKDSEIPDYCCDCEWLEYNECIFIDIIHSKFNCGLGKGYTQIKSKSSQLYPNAIVTKKDSKIPDYCHGCEWLENSKCIFKDTLKTGFKCEVEKSFWMKVQKIKKKEFYKIIIIGDTGVGKTSLLTKFAPSFLGKNYIQKLCSITGVYITSKTLEVCSPLGEPIKLNFIFWDIVGQPQFYMMQPPYFNGADGMILVFDVASSSTFSNINNWYSTAVNCELSGIPRFLIGNKIDLNNDRRVTRPMAKELSKKLNAPYFETSALTGDNVKLTFHKIAELIYSHLEFLFYENYRKKWS